ncbi:MAG: transcription termination factor NusA [Candidatus Hydrogenedentes bacterium]|nr:transcription termination factor NusA [Candidatus Hydrogenedentota bacterium]
MDAKELNLQAILQQLQAEKSVDRATLLEAIRSAIETAARKSFAPTAVIAVDIDPKSLAWKVFELRDVVEEITDAAKEMTLDEAQHLNAAAQIGDTLKVPAEAKDFGRIAAQTAKQVIIQKLKDAERENVYDEFKKREGELVAGVVKRVSHGNVIVTVGKAEAILPQGQQSARENFKPGDRIRAYLFEVKKDQRGTQVVLSRTSPELVRALFDLEVPEIYDGTVVIRGIAREPGSRTKIAVWSTDPNVDPVGACVGMKGSRVRAVVEELCGEKIDIVRWSDDPVEMCGNALNPADILDITVDEEAKSIIVIVPNDQLSLAIGKRGQNARLASRLMGWSIDIKSDTELSGDEGADSVASAVATDSESGGGVASAVASDSEKLRDAE